jgi:hypothetical protein
MNGSGNDPLSDEDVPFSDHNKTQQTEIIDGAHCQSDQLHEESDHYMLTKFRSGEGRQHRLSQNSNEISGQKAPSSITATHYTIE